MHNVVIDKPYKFEPPCHGVLVARLLQRLVPRRLRRQFGLGKIDYRGLDHLRQSLDAGHGIVLAPNHCRPADPFVVSELARQVGVAPYVMASWHLFMQSRFQAWMLRRSGVFSIYREGMDRSAVNTAVEILVQARRPLVIFPEGVITRSNDRLVALMEGTALIARSAAKKRAKASPPGRVVIHPVAIRYLFHGDAAASVEPVLSHIEGRLSWRPKRDLPLIDRIVLTGEALLGLKEMEYFGNPQPGTLIERVDGLIDRILVPLEQEWLAGKSDTTVVARVKKLRIAVLPDMVKGDISETERDRRWRQLADMYLAQQLSLYPPDYLKTHPTPERILETVERLEEDLTDAARIHRPMSAVVAVGAAIEVASERERGPDGDYLMTQLEERLQALLDASLVEHRPQASAALSS